PPIFSPSFSLSPYISPLPPSLISSTLPSPMDLNCHHPSQFHHKSSFLTRYINFYINIIVPDWFWHISTTMHAFISTPTPSPPLLPSSTMDTCLIPKIITFMAQQKWSTAFEAISTLPNPVHPHSAKTATFDDLHHINSLFEAIMHHHAYGIDANTDQTLNQLLLTALQICQTLKSSSLPSSPDYDTEYISWSPPSHISIQDHLDFYRTVIHYFNAFTTTNSSESLLIDANRILHQLSPRINNLSTWNPKTTQTASSQQKRRQIVYAVHSAQAIKKSAETKKQWSLRLRSRPPAAQSGVNRKGWYPTPSPTPRKLRPRTQKPKKPVVVVLPLTPLTQSGDVCPWISPSYKSTGEYLPS
ncbi:hypothetical protein QBC38DRAFT_515714, partial [Podospora fimiseda]